MDCQVVIAIFQRFCCKGEEPGLFWKKGSFNLGRYPNK